MERVYRYEGSQPHAVTSLMSDQSSVGSYQYDANGNMTCRMEDGQWFIQGYNEENRIASISRLDGPCGSGNILESWFYQYDGDGVRVEERYFVGTTLTSTKAYYMGGLYEVTDGAVKKYYSIAGQTVALRDDSGLQYLLTDHLGSVVAVTNASGTLTSQQRYLPFGEVRTIPDSPITITDFGFTGQRALDGTGLMDYRARFYSPYLNRFIQPDTIIPNPSSPQSWNRFSYVANNPLRFTDPSGHMEVEGCGDQGKDKCHASDLEIAINAQKLAELDYDPTGEKQERNAEIAEAILYGGTELLASILFEPADWAFTAYHCASGDCSPLMLLGLLPLIPSQSSRLLRYIHPDHILPNGSVMSRAFKDPTMSVFDEALGATPEMVLEVMSKNAGVPGKGGVMGLDLSQLVSVNGINNVIREIGTTGNSILDAAHSVVLNLGTRSVAQHIRDIAQWLIP
ncbi:MAG: RHS repeat-associated core domain-containing protein [Chloroflexota bacterium]